MVVPVQKDSQDREFVPVGGPDGGPVQQASAPLAQKIVYGTFGGASQPEYICEAPPGTAQATAKWRCKKLSYNGNGLVNGVTWADGDDNFDNTASNPAAHSYS